MTDQLMLFTEIIAIFLCNTTSVGTLVGKMYGFLLLEQAVHIVTILRYKKFRHNQYIKFRSAGM